MHESLWQRCNGKAVANEHASRQFGAKRRRLSTPTEQRVRSRGMRVTACPTTTRMTVWGYRVGETSRVYKAAAPADQDLFLSRLSGRSKPQGAPWAFEAYRVPILALWSRARSPPCPVGAPDNQRLSVDPRTVRSRVRALPYSVGCNRRPELPTHIPVIRLAVFTAPERITVFTAPGTYSRFHGSWNVQPFSRLLEEEPYSRLPDEGRFHGSRTIAVPTAPEDNRFHDSWTSTRFPDDSIVGSWDTSRRHGS